MRIGGRSYDIPSEPEQQGWYYYGTCTCNGMFSIKFHHKSYPHWELRYTPGFAKTGKTLRLRHYNSAQGGYFTPAELESKTQKLINATTPSASKP